MALETVRGIETVLGGPLPADYRSFLATHETKYLEPALLLRHKVAVPGSGSEDMVSALLTAADILDSDVLGDPEEKMVIIGYVEPGGCLYMCFSTSAFGSVHIRFPYQDSTFYPVGESFADFMAHCRPDPGADA